MKASSVTTTKVTVFITRSELLEMIRAAGIHVPAGAAISIDYPPFDDNDNDGVNLEWSEDHGPKQKG